MTNEGPTFKKGALHYDPEQQTADRHAVDYGRPGTHLAALAATIADERAAQRQAIDRLTAERDDSDAECVRLMNERDRYLDRANLLSAKVNQIAAENKALGEEAALLREIDAVRHGTIRRITGERDRARDLAARLEAECARPQALRCGCCGAPRTSRPPQTARPSPGSGKPSGRSRPKSATETVSDVARLMSVAFTEQAVIERRKTVTRRKGWWTDKHGRHLVKPGDRLLLVDRVMGFKKGERATVLAEVEVVSVRRESLSVLADWYGDDEHREQCAEIRREGFNPDVIGPAAFVYRYFVKAQGMAFDDDVTRIEWRYLADGE